VGYWYSPQYSVGAHMSHEDVQNKDDWRLKMKCNRLTQAYLENGR